MKTKSIHFGRQVREWEILGDFGRIRVGRRGHGVSSFASFPCAFRYVDFYHSGSLGLANQWPASIESSQKPQHRKHLPGPREDVSGESWCSQGPTNFLDSLLSKNRHQHLPRRPHGQSDRMPSTESLILSQRQTSEALASPLPRPPHGQTGEDEGQRSALPRAAIRSAGLGSLATPRPWSPTGDSRRPSVFPFGSAPHLPVTERSLGSRGSPQRILCATAQIPRPC